jgi:hypothetical protein
MLILLLCAGPAWANPAFDGLARVLLTETEAGARVATGVLGRTLKSVSEVDDLFRALTREQADELAWSSARLGERIAARPVLELQASDPVARETLARRFLGSYTERFLGARQAFLHGRPSAAELERVARGAPLVREQAVSTSAWPKVTAYRFVRSSPEHVAAVFSDPGLQQRLVPELAKAQLASPEGLAFLVDFELKVPVLSNIKYRLSQRLSEPRPGVIRLEWAKADPSTSPIEAIEGYATFEPFEDGTLLTYHHFVTPSSRRLAGLLRGRALEGVKETSERLSAFAESERAGARGSYLARAGAFLAKMGW